MFHVIGAGQSGNIFAHRNERGNAILLNQDQHLGSPDEVPGLVRSHPPDHTVERAIALDEDNILDIATRLHQSGRIQAAEKAYMTFLEVCSEFVHRGSVELATRSTEQTMYDVPGSFSILSVMPIYCTPKSDFRPRFSTAYLAWDGDVLRWPYRPTHHM